MKKLLTTVSILLTGIISLAQTTRIYEIRSNVPVWPCGILGERIETTQFCDPPYNYCIPPYGSWFAIVRTADSGGIVIRFLNWSKKKPKGAENYYKFNKMATGNVNTNVLNQPAVMNNTNNQGAEIQRYFLIRQVDLDSNCIPVYSSGKESLAFTVGLVTMPVKLRLGTNFDFQGSFSLGSTAGVKMRISPYNDNYVNLLFGASISTITLDSFSTGGRVSGQPLTNIATFSPSLGLVFEFGRAQAGIFYGWDLLSKSMQSQYQWIHNKKPWISVGFGFSIFGVSSSSGQAETQQR